MKQIVEACIISVYIPPQEWSLDKYAGNNRQRCYLAEALDKAGYKDVSVSGWGETFIGNIQYKPVEPFDGDIVKEALKAGKGLTVNLKPIIYSESIN